MSPIVKLEGTDPFRLKSPRPTRAPGFFGPDLFPEFRTQRTPSPTPSIQVRPPTEEAMSQTATTGPPTVDQVLRQMETMTAQIDRLSAQTQELKEENDQLKAEAAGREQTPFRFPLPPSQPPTPAPVRPAPTNLAPVNEARALVEAMRLVIAAEPKRPKARVPPPNPYDGKKDTLDQFVKECEEWLTDNEVLDDQSRIRLMGAYMKEGEAAKWITQKYNDRTVWTDRDAFVAEIRMRFGDIDPQFTAQEKIEALRQTRSVEEYNAEFKKYATQTGYSEVDLRRRYQKGLNTGIITKIYGAGRLPADMEGWYATALHFDQLYQQLQQIRPRAGGKVEERPRGPTKETTVTTTERKTTSADYKPGTSGPMDIDTAKREKVCRHCAQPWTFGHSCEKKRTAQDLYKKRAGAQRNEVATGGRRNEEEKEDPEAVIAALRDQLVIMRKQMEEVKDAED